MIDGLAGEDVPKDRSARCADVGSVKARSRCVDAYLFLVAASLEIIRPPNRISQWR